MFRRYISLATLLFGLLAGIGHARADVAGSVPTGFWLTADGSAVIQIAPCKTGLCGEIVGIHLKHPGDPMPEDWLGQPQCGLKIIQTAAVSDTPGNTAWKGYVLDPRSGTFHSAILALDALRHLVLRGYLFFPILGRSTTWTAYTGVTLPNCHLPG